jgi:hypothetical protein
MSRHFDFRNDGNAAELGVFHEIAQFRLGVKALIGFGFVVFGRETRAFTGKFGVFFDFHAPALVVGEMEVEYVHFIEGEVVDGFFEVFDGLEGAGAVEHESAPGESGLIRNGEAVEGNRLGNRSEWEGLPE